MASHAHRRKCNRDVKPHVLSVRFPNKKKSQIRNSSLCLLQVDLRTDQLVATLVWPLERYGCIAELQQLGHDALVRNSCVLHTWQQTKMPSNLTWSEPLAPVTLTTVRPPPLLPSALQVLLILLPPGPAAAIGCEAGLFDDWHAVLGKAGPHSCAQSSSGQ